MYRSVCIQGMCIKETNWFILGFQNAACGFCNSILQPLLLFWKPSQSSLLVARLTFRTIDSGLFLPLSLFLNISRNIYALKVKRSSGCRRWSSIFNCRLGVVQTAAQAPSRRRAPRIHLDPFPSPAPEMCWVLPAFVGVWLSPPLGATTDLSVESWG